MPKGGKRPGAGRPKGSANKETKQLREMILEALDMKGGAAYLAKQAEETPAAFMSLLGRVLPLQVQGDKENPLLTGLKVTFVKPD